MHQLPLISLVGKVFSQSAKSVSIQGALQLCITAQEVGTNHLIDSIFIEVQQSSSDPLSDTWYLDGVQNVASIELKFQVSCAPNFIPDSVCSTCKPGYSGDGCYDYCEDTDDESGHFTCNSDGTITCNDGYKDEASNCVQCVPAEGCCKY